MISKHGASDDKDCVIIKPQKDMVSLINERGRDITDFTADPQHPGGAVALRIGPSRRAASQVRVDAPSEELPPRPKRLPPRASFVELYASAPWRKSRDTMPPGTSDPQAMAHAPCTMEQDSGLSMASGSDSSVWALLGRDAFLSPPPPPPPPGAGSVVFEPCEVLKEELDEVLKNATSKIIGQMMDVELTLIDLTETAEAAVAEGLESTLHEVLSQAASVGEEEGAARLKHAQEGAILLTQNEEAEVWEEEADFEVDAGPDDEGQDEGNGSGPGAKQEEGLFPKAPQTDFDVATDERKMKRIEIQLKYFGSSKVPRFQGAIGTPLSRLVVNPWKNCA
jgi:hypothetical protein